MSFNAKNVLGINITIDHKEDILEEIEKYFEKVKSQKSKIKSDTIKPFIIFTPNPEIINYAQKDSLFKKIVNSAQINLPDSWGVVWAINKLYRIKIAKIAGVDFVEDLVYLANKKSLRIGLIGGRKEVALRTLECLKKEYPNLTGWAIDGPEIKITNNKLQITKKYQNPNNQIKEIIEKIIREKTDILFVALGFPKQEYFMDRITNQESRITNNSSLIMMAVGGAFDCISGALPRAPKWLRDRGFEWLYRLIRQPWRITRQIKGARFFWMVLRHNKS